MNSVREGENKVLEPPIGDVTKEKDDPETGNRTEDIISWTSKGMKKEVVIQEMLITDKTVDRG